MNRSLPDITESLKDRLRSESVGYKKQRLTAVYLLQSGGAKNRKQVADLIGVNRKTVGQWLDAYEAGGSDVSPTLSPRQSPFAFPSSMRSQPRLSGIGESFFAARHLMVCCSVPRRMSCCLWFKEESPHAASNQWH